MLAEMQYTKTRVEETGDIPGTGMNMVHNDNRLRGRLAFDEPMAGHTSWRAGGKADLYFEPADLEDLCYFLRKYADEHPLLWTGLGSNLLVRDGGFRGVVIAYSQALRELDIRDDGSVSVGAGVTCAKVAKLTSRQGFAGAEFLAGIPGCMGGALAMNAGAFGSETWNIITAVRTIDRDGRICKQPVTDFRIGYRSVHTEKETWFISAELILQPDPAANSADTIKTLLDKRAQTQPVGLHSCGSVFRNPPGDHAGRLIEACGLKGMQYGNASISEKHANFIINQGGASAADIEFLITKAQAAVQEKFNIKLIPEAKIVGETTENPEP